jgi:hypothetical protein
VERPDEPNEPGTSDQNADRDGTREQPPYADGLLLRTLAIRECSFVIRALPVSAIGELRGHAG